MKFGIIGCGNMANAIVNGIYVAHKEIEFHTYTPSYTRAEKLAFAVDGKAHKKLEDIPEMDFWLVACKPQQFSELVEQLNGKLKNQNIISVMAAVNIAKLETSLDSKNITRIMTNTPCSIGLGISLIIHHSTIQEASQKVIESMFNSLGVVFSCETEKQFDELTVVTGSGPAYIFEIAKHYANSMEKMGLNTDQARSLINQLFLGSSKLMSKEELDLSSLVDRVTSKGGVTIEAIKHLRSQSLNKHINDSLGLAITRSNEITQDYS